MARRGKSQRNLELKPKQVALVKNLVVGMTITEAARRAGYSRKCPGQAGYQALQNLKLKMPELLDRLGLSEAVLIEKHLKPLLRARTMKFFQHGGKVTGKRVVIDNDARLRALDMVFKLRGSFLQADPKLAEPTGVKVIIMDVPRPPRPVAVAASPQLPSSDPRSIPTGEHPGSKNPLAFKPKLPPSSIA
jgi:hypothetical protein